MKPLRLSKRYLSFGVGIVIVLIVVGSAVYLLWPRSLVPNSIRHQLTSVLYVPQQQSVVVNRASFKYDTSQKLLTYVVTYHAANKLTVSEQATPDEFADIPDLYTKLTNGLNNYATFDSVNGTVYLTLPPNQQGKQVAVMNSKGTLLFIKADNKLSVDEWKQVFNNLNVVQ